MRMESQEKQPMEACENAQCGLGSGGRSLDIKESLHVGFVYEGKIVRNGSLIHIQAEQQNIYMHADGSVHT